ncbi:hypothetical protein ACWNT8_07005 [Pigmentibacter ruber]|uniref:hypothetical protein n=1 Tax=Pigmentibacter ruber TaxID=2683196 RepID=UPI00131A6498|nr:hypothetical protein [Pigmentibacter ruber]BFD32985.1 hypothetical protein GTC16762_26030 [Pigmentibacter ruber]
MKKYHTLKCILGINFVFLLTSCTSMNGKKENVSIVNPPIVNPSPSVIPNSTGKNNSTKSTEFKEYLEIISDIEEQFLAQNCVEVLSKVKKLENLVKNINLNSLPPLAQAAIYSCDARAGMDNPLRVQKAVTVLQGLSLRYPVIHEPWLHNMLSDFYFALGDKQNALAEKRLARDLILAQQQDISSLNAQILQINPSEPGLSQNSNSNNESSGNFNQDQIAASASQMLNNDSPEQAIALIDSIPPNQRNDNLKRIRSDAINSLVTNLRYKVRALFVRSTQQTGSARKETLQQSEQILKGIIKNYPEYTDMAAVQNNLKQVQRELAKP